MRDHPPVRPHGDWYWQRGEYADDSVSREERAARWAPCDNAPLCSLTGDHHGQCCAGQDTDSGAPT